MNVLILEGVAKKTVISSPSDEFVRTDGGYAEEKSFDAFLVCEASLIFEHHIVRVVITPSRQSLAVY